MKERPILFSAPMVRALLAGTKTQTRRVLKTRPAPHGDIRCFDMPGGRHSLIVDDAMGLAWVPAGSGPREPWPAERMRGASPYGGAGDRLWVRETWSKDAADRVYPCPGIWYRADFKTDDPATGEHARHCKAEQTNRPDGECFACACRFRWKPSIHMLRRDSRITLDVAGVRVERLQDISGRDVLAEGVDNGKSNPAQGVRWENMQRLAFESLWSSINGAESWSSNPWVWVVEFRRVQ